MQMTDIDLGNTSIENIFINDYMPMANGTYVKVYLLGYKYANDRDSNLEITNNTLSRQLSIPLSDVLNAWDFWEDKGIIKKHFNSDNMHDYNVEFLSLKQLYINNIIKPSAVSKSNDSSYLQPANSTVEELAEAKNTPVINEMFNKIRTVMRRYITPNEYKRIYDWMNTYNMTPDVIVKAFEYSTEKKNKRTLSFIEGIIRNWYDDGVTNIQSLDRYLSTKDENFYRYNRIFRELGLRGLPSIPQKKLINKWFYEFEYDLDIVLKACEETIKIKEPNLKYVDGILSKWYVDNVKTIEDIKERAETFKKEKTINKPNNVRIPSKPKNIKTKFHNFEQTSSKYSAKELEDKLLNKYKK